MGYQTHCLPFGCILWLRSNDLEKRAIPQFGRMYSTYFGDVLELY